jgi:hypothetical protein
MPGSEGGVGKQARDHVGQPKRPAPTLRQNRLCPRCKNELDQEPSEEPSHDLPTPIRRSRLREDG